MDPAILRSLRIEQFLDVCFMTRPALLARVPHPLLVLELDQADLQKRAIGFRTSLVDTDAVRALWAQMAELQKHGKRLKSDGMVRFVFAVKKREDVAFSDRIIV